MAYSPESEPRMLSRTIVRSTSISRNGETDAVIIFPMQFPEYKQLAETLAIAIEKRSGARPDCISSSEIFTARDTRLPERYRRHPLILIGNLNNNPALTPLYARFYCATDSTYPGSDGYDLRTLVNPYGTGSNVILAGGSTLRGCQRAVERLISHIDDANGQDELTLPFLLDVEIEPNLKQMLIDWPEAPPDAALPKVEDGMKKALGFNEGLTRAIGSYTSLYSWTGDERYALYARNCLKMLNEMVTDSYGDWHYRAERLLIALPLLIAGGFLEDADILRADELLLGTALATQDMWWRMRHDKPPLGHRHHGKGTHEFYLLARYLRFQANPNPAAKSLCDRWIKECETFLDALGCTCGTDDQDDESSLNNMATLYWYALSAEKYGFFESGHARRIASRALALHDNKGAGAGQGGYGEGLSGALYVQQEATAPVAACVFYYQDSQLKWILENMPNLSVPIRYGFLHFSPPFMHKFDTGPELPPEPPDDLGGIQRLPVTSHQFAIDNNPPEHIEPAGHLVNAPETWLMAEGVGVNKLPQEKGFDKLVMRSGFTTDDSYLLLQGYQGGYRWQGHMQAANCIVRFSQFGHSFLIQNTARHSLFHKNGVFVSNGFNNSPLQPIAEWLAIDDFSGLGLSTTRLSEYHGAEWVRSIFWAKSGNGYFVVIDSILPDANGSASLTCTWRTPAYATLKERTWQSRQGAHQFILKCSETLKMTNESCSEADKQGAANPFVLRQVKTGNFNQNTRISFENIFYVKSQAATASLDIRHIAPGQVVILENEAPVTWCGVGDKTRHLAGPTFTAKAVCGWVSEHEIAFSALQSLSAKDEIKWHFESDQPVGFHLDLKSAQLTLRPDTPQDQTIAFEFDFGGEKRSDQVAADTSAKFDMSAEVCASVAQSIRNQVCAISASETREPEPRQSITSRSGWGSDWKFDNWERIPERIRDVTIEANPAPVDGFPEQLIDTMLPELRETWIQWHRALRYELLLSFPAEKSIDRLRIVGDSHHDPILRKFNPLPQEIEVCVSSYGFKQDVRPCEVSRESGTLLYKRYRDMADSFETREVMVGQVARQIRVNIAAPSDGRQLVLNEIEIYSTNTVSPAIRHIFAADLQNDGNPVAIITNEANELVVLEADGSVRWRQKMPRAVTHLSCLELDADGEKWLCLGLLGGELRILSADGSLRQSIQLAEQFKNRTDAFFGWFGTIHSINIWHREASGRAALVLGGYAIIIFLDPDGNIIGHSFGDGPWITDILATQPDGSGARDLWVRCGWNHGVFYYEGTPGAAPSGEYVTFGGVEQPMFRPLRKVIPFVNGKTVTFEWLDESGKYILAAAENGVGVLSTHTKDWLCKIEGGTPISACLAGGSLDEIIIGGADGFITAFSAQDGRPLRRLLLGAPVVGCAMLKRNSVLAVATREGIHAIDPDFKQYGCYSARIRRMIRFGNDRILIERDDGVLEMLKLDV
ncbi:hypothetical protein JXJ21_10415 [candidate division KSB1 bacterium]|nr:hypothetical protein [candidate division KSB1 bacterium]